MKPSLNAFFLFLACLFLLSSCLSASSGTHALPPPRIERIAALVQEEPAKAFALAWNYRTDEKAKLDPEALSSILSASFARMSELLGKSVEERAWVEALAQRRNIERATQHDKSHALPPSLEPWTEQALIKAQARELSQRGDSGRALLWWEKSFQSGIPGKEDLEEALGLALAARNLSAQKSILSRMRELGMRLPPQAADIDSQKNSFQDMVKGVCTIWVNRGLKMESGVAIPDRVIGSGFFIDPRGYLLSNYHVISSEVDPEYEGYSRLYIRLPGSKEERIPAKVIGWDKNLDLALLKVSYTPDYIFSISRGRSFVPGDRIYAIGSPIGLESSISSGIVSAVGREILSMGEALQVDVPVNPGNSGGPLLDENGELAGIVFAGLLDFQGLNFAIPLSWLSLALDSLYAGGELAYGFLGLCVREDGGILRATYPLYASPAREFGLETGDIIRSIDGKKYDNFVSANAYLSAQRPGALIALELERGGDIFTKLISLSKRPNLPLKEAMGKEIRERLLPPLYGMEVEELPRDFLSKSYRITKVYPGSVADEAGLSENDPFTLHSWKVDLKQGFVVMQLYIKKRKQGFLESLIQLPASLQAPRFL